MKVKGRLKNLNYNIEGKPQVTFELERYLDINKIYEIKEEDLLNINISKAKKSRTLDQNNLLWAIISDIDRKINGIPSEIFRWDLYIQGIEEAGIEYEDVLIPQKSLKIFKQAFRAYKILGEKEDKILLRCFLGSSKFDTKQMTNLIDYFLKKASELGVTIVDYREEYERLFY
ncbi:hypothetical protein ACQRC6_01195 [Peptoniphilus sp. SGI.035]|uniref:hypothetical protein n=1 Tax=Peptoniphilus sp. SGI.035 TaxID=3420564 RepID=UPI003CFC2E69